MEDRNEKAVKSKRSYTEGKTREDLIGNIGFGERVKVDRKKKVRVLVTGAGSYIGEAFRKYVLVHYNANIVVETLDMLDKSWMQKDFSGYDIVYHVAGLAHADVGNVSEETKEKYYAINTDLAVEVARKGKNEGIKEFIFMSSMIVYGESSRIDAEKLIDENTVPVPANFYGDSKLQADVAVRELADENFKVVVLRPPMIYGRSSKGNYQVLSQIAKRVPVFPAIDNKRSMLHIDNLCEFLCQIMLIEKFKRNSIVLMPQNKEWIKTSDMVRFISGASNKKTIVTKTLNPAVRLARLVPGKISGLVDKAFGNSCYAHEVSEYEGIDYQVNGLKESILKTEARDLVEEIDYSSFPKFTIVTIAYNCADTISRTIESVLKQDYKNVEYLIIDGASSDGTAKVAEKYKEAFEKKGYSYIISSEPDKGIYDAMNKGIKKASGEIIGILNAGDWYKNETISFVAKTYAETRFDYFYGDIKLVKKNGKSFVKHSRPDKHPSSRHWNHPSSFVTKKTYEELGTFKGAGIHDDFDFFLRVRRAGKKLVIRNKVLANFALGGTSNEKSFKKCKERCMDRYKCYKENGYSSLYLIECLEIEVVKFVLS